MHVRRRLRYVSVMWRSVPPGHALLVQRQDRPPVVRTSGRVFALPWHRVDAIDLGARVLRIERRGANAVSCRDGIRADLVLTLRLRVDPTAENLVWVASAIGAERATDAQTIETLFSAKLHETIAALAHLVDFEQLHGDRARFRDDVVAIVAPSLRGYLIDDAALELAQAPLATYDKHDVIDAVGLQKLAEIAARHRVDLDGARARLAHGVARAEAAHQLADELRRYGVLDVAYATEVSCDVPPDRAELVVTLGGGDDDVLAQLPASITRPLLDEVGRGELVCRGGRATLRWTTELPTPAQLVAGARLVYALRGDPHAYR